MRNDAVRDHYPVHCYNTSLGEYKAFPGDVIIYREWRDSERNEWHSAIGRVVCRIHHAPALNQNEQPIKNHLCVIQLFNLNYGHERWIAPEQVYQIIKNEDLQECRDFMNTFLGENWVNLDFQRNAHGSIKNWMEYLIQWAASGFKTFAAWDKYRLPRD